MSELFEENDTLGCDGVKDVYLFFVLVEMHAGQSAKDCIVEVDFCDKLSTLGLWNFFIGRI